MLIYTSCGPRHFGSDPVQVKMRSHWEFWILLSGQVTPTLSGPSASEAVTEPTLWAFPPDCAFGWHGSGASERLVFDFSAVPVELEQLLPARGYYRGPLSPQDCDRLRSLPAIAERSLSKPTQLISLQQDAIAAELSLMALREVPAQPLGSGQKAEMKTEQALRYFESDLTERPDLEDIARAVHMSPAHLRRFFHTARGESPRAAFNRVRMRRAEELLKNSNLTLEQIAHSVGLSGAPALTRAVKRHFGITPGHLRKLRDSQVERGF